MPPSPADRPKNREVEHEDLKTPSAPNKPPHSATEPRGSEGSSRNTETAADPQTGEPN